MAYNERLAAPLAPLFTAIAATPEPELTVSPLNCWLLLAAGAPWTTSDPPPPKVSEELFDAKLTILLGGAVAAAKFSTRFPALTVVVPV